METGAEAALAANSQVTSITVEDTAADIMANAAALAGNPQIKSIVVVDTTANALADAGSVQGDAVVVSDTAANVSAARIVIGPGIASISDADIVEMYNEILDAQWGLLQQWDKTVVEEPPGEQQIDYHENSDQWVARGEVLRCVIDDAGPNGEVTIHDQELSLPEFGRLLSVRAGWGMRIAFVPEEFVAENPTVKIRERNRSKR